MTATHEPPAQAAPTAEARAAQAQEAAARAADARTAERYTDAVTSFTELARALARHESVPDALQSILALILRVVPDCHAASVTVLDEKSEPSTIMATSAETYEMDRRQYVLRDGPCMDAARRQQVNRWSLQEARQRWPDFTRLAEEMGLRSYLSAGLSWEGAVLGALNLSSRDTAGFDQVDERMLALFTAPATAAIVVTSRYSKARDLAAQLEQALQSRAVIDQAIGIVMAESRCDPAEAFAVLGRASNNRNMKLRDLATEIVARVSGRLSSRPAG